MARPQRVEGNQTSNLDCLKYSTHVFDHVFMYATPPVRIVRGTVEIFMGWKLPSLYLRMGLDDILDVLVQHRQLLDESKTVQDVPNLMPNNNVIERFEKLKQTNMRKYIDLLNMPEHYVWGNPAYTVDIVIDPECTTTDHRVYRRLTDQTGTLFLSSEESTFLLLSSKVYLHPYWLPWAHRHRFWSSDENLKFYILFYKALCKVFVPHQEKEHALSMAGRPRNAECPPKSTLLYVRSTLKSALTGYVAHGQFEDRMRYYELSLQAESMLGSRNFRSTLLSDEELQDVRHCLRLDWLPTDGRLTGLYPSYKSIAAEHLCESAEEEMDEDPDSSNVQVRLWARILQLLIEADECLSVLSDEKLQDTFSLLISQMKGEQDGNNSLRVKMAARLIKMHVQADDCLSHLTDKDRNAVFTALLDRYTEDE